MDLVCFNKIKPHVTRQKQVKKFMNESYIKLLEWPENCPDQNPIENLWSICTLRTMDCTLKEKMIQALSQMNHYKDPQIYNIVQNWSSNAQTQQIAS